MVLTTAALVARVVGSTDLVGVVPSSELLDESVSRVALPPEVSRQPHHLFWALGAEGDPEVDWFVSTVARVRRRRRSPLTAAPDPSRFAGLSGGDSG